VCNRTILKKEKHTSSSTMMIISNPAALVAATAEGRDMALYDAVDGDFLPVRARTRASSTKKTTPKHSSALVGPKKQVEFSTEAQGNYFGALEDDVIEEGVADESAGEWDVQKAKAKQVARVVTTQTAVDVITQEELNVICNMYQEQDAKNGAASNNGERAGNENSESQDDPAGKGGEEEAMDMPVDGSDGNEDENNDGGKKDAEASDDEDDDDEEDEDEDEQEMDQTIAWLSKVMALEKKKDTTYKAVTVACHIPDIDDDHPLTKSELVPADEVYFNHHPFIKKIGKLIYAFREKDPKIKVMSSIGNLSLEPSVIDGPWTNRRIKSRFNYCLHKSSDDPRSPNLTICLLIDYTSQKNLHHAKQLVMDTLIKEKLYVRYHSDASLTVEAKKIGFLTRHHPDFVHIEALQLRLHEAMKQTYVRNKGRYDRIIEKYKAKPIESPDYLPQLQLHKHQTNPLLRTGGSFPAINLYAPTQYRALYRSILSDMATIWRGWEYCDTSLTKVPTLAKMVATQVRQFREFTDTHRIVKILHMTSAEMKNAHSKLFRLENVKAITSTPVTLKNGMWLILVSAFIPETELLTIDSIVARHVILESERPFLNAPYRLGDPRDHMPQGYLEKLKKQYMSRPNAAPPTQSAWKSLPKTIETGSVGTAPTVGMSQDELEAILEGFRGEMKSVQKTVDTFDTRLEATEKGVKDVDDRVTVAISDIEIEKSERKEEMRGMRDELSGLRNTMDDGQKTTAALIANLQMNLQNQMKTSVTKDFFERGMSRLENLIVIGQQTQTQAHIQYQINAGQMDGCLNKHAHDNKENENMPSKLQKTNESNPDGGVSAQVRNCFPDEPYRKTPQNNIIVNDANVQNLTPVSPDSTTTGAKTPMDTGNE